MISAAVLDALVAAGATAEIIAAAVKADIAEAEAKEDERLLMLRERVRRCRERKRLVTLQSVTPETKVPTPLKTQPKETPPIGGSKESSPEDRERLDSERGKP